MIIKIVFYKSSSKFYDSVCTNCGIFENFIQNKSENILTLTFEELKEHFFELKHIMLTIKNWSKTEYYIDEKEATELSQKMLENDFTYDDYLTALEQMKKLGPLNKIMEMIPGMPKEIKDIDFAAGEKELAKVKAIIQSMTAKERKNPKLIVGSSTRKKRIAQGSGTSLQAVNKLIKGHEMMRKQMKQFKSLTKKPGKKGLFGKLPF